MPAVRYHAASTAAEGHATKTWSGPASEMCDPTQVGFLAVKVTGIAVVVVVAGSLR